MEPNALEGEAAYFADRMPESCQVVLDTAELGYWDYDFPKKGLFGDRRCRALHEQQGDPFITPEQFLELIHPEDRLMVAQTLFSALDPSSSGRYSVDYRTLLSDGTIRWIGSKGRAFFEGEGAQRHAVRFVGTVMDITARKEAEEALRVKEESERQRAAALEQLADELARSNKDLERFAYVVSHDLQEPLRQIVGFGRLLKRRYAPHLDSSGQEFVDFIVDSGSRMQNLIGDLLAFSRVGRGGKQKTRVYVRDVIEAALQNLRAAISESETMVTQDPMPDVQGDEFQLIQLFQNLISNAIRFRSDRPLKIHISAQQKGQEWLFGVSDNGTGVLPEHMEKMFEMFERFSERRENQGTGIGLSICKRVIELHGGRIWAESEYGSGTTIYFTLPPAQ